MIPRPRIVIIGAGFAGLWAVRSLRRTDVDILLIDRSNHHTFQPLLYQVATAGLAAPSIAAPLRHILRRQRNLTVLLGNVTGDRYVARGASSPMGRPTPTTISSSRPASRTRTSVMTNGEATRWV